MPEDLAVLSTLQDNVRKSILWKASPVLQRQEQSPWERPSFRKSNRGSEGAFFPRGQGNGWTGQLWVACDVGTAFPEMPQACDTAQCVLLQDPQTAFLKKKSIESKDFNSSGNSMKVALLACQSLSLLPPTSVLPPQGEEKSFMEMVFKIWLLLQKSYTQQNRSSDSYVVTASA